MKRLFLFFNLLIIPGVSFSAQEEIILEHAEHAEYLKITGEEIITLWGEVKLNSGKMCLKADWVQLNLTKNDLLARGNVNLIDEQGNRIASKEIQYNLGTSQGKMSEVTIFAKPYYCKGKEALFKPGSITLMNASLSTCDLPKPHYCLTTPKIILYPNKRIVSKNILLRVGKIPLFYLPSLSMSLKERKTKVIIKPGKSEEKGNSLGITYEYPFTPRSVGSLHLNCLGKQGFGQGIEHKYKKDSDSQGTSYLYYINERKKRNDVKDTKRWEVEAKHLHRFEDITGVLNLQLLSDNNVTRDYLREERCRAGTWESKNYFALTKTYPNQTLRLLWERINLWDNVGQDFKKGTTLLPDLNLQTKSILKNNIYSNLNIEVANQFCAAATGTHYLKAEIGGNLLSKAILVSERIVFSPKIGLSGIFKEKEKATGELNTSLNLRNRMGRYLEINLNHNLRKGFTTDEYYGIKANALTSNIYLWMNRKMRGEITTGIDLRQQKHKTLNINHERLLPLVGELNLSLSNNLTTSLKTTYNCKDSEIEEVEAYFDLKRAQWQYGGSGLYRRASTGEKDIGDVSNYVAFSISPKTHLRVSAYYDVQNHNIKESSLTIDQDLHCWNSKLSIRHGQDTEICISLNIK
ncbi:MAG: hypothetical protein QME42_10895 [bacterium]|nr:hypothetical protein [bacterium]